MSYASDVKKELTTLPVHRENAKAELMAIIRMNGSLKIANQHWALDVQSENPTIARRLYSLLLQFYQISAKVIVRKKMKLKKNKVYVVRITKNVADILDDLGILNGNQILETVPVNLLKDEGQVRSYLRGAFLAGGSINSPETSRYHLEIYSLYPEHNQMIAEMMNQFQLGAKTTKRRSGNIAYLKEAEKISDFLELIGATKARLRFEDVRIVRDLNNSVNRLVNCENANMNKVANASTKQVENIKLIQDEVGLDKLPPKLAQMAKVRLKHQEVSLKELGGLVPGGPISKSGVNHRLRKINDFALEVKNGKIKQ